MMLLDLAGKVKIYSSSAGFGGFGGFGGFPGGAAGPFGSGDFSSLGNMPQTVRKQNCRVIKLKMCHHNYKYCSKLLN